jgi:hypothetical protein
VATCFICSVSELSVEVIAERKESSSTTTTTSAFTRPHIMRALLSKISARFVRRKQGFRADLRVGEVSILGDETMPKVLYVDTRSRVRALSNANSDDDADEFYDAVEELEDVLEDQMRDPEPLMGNVGGVRVSHLPPDERAQCVREEHQGDMMVLTVDCLPLSGDVDIAITAQMLPCCLNLNLEFVSVMGGWVRDVEGSLAHASELGDRTREGLARYMCVCVCLCVCVCSEDFAKICVSLCVCVCVCVV